MRITEYPKGFKGLLFMALNVLCLFNIHSKPKGWKCCMFCGEDLPTKEQS